MTDGRPLTPREQQFLTLIGQGQTTAEIAERFGLSRATVRTTLERAMHKLGAKTLPHAIALLLTEQRGRVEE